jgi:hypothetical protein
MRDILIRLSQNPKTTIFGLVKIIGAIWFLVTHPEVMSAMHLMHPETLIPIGVMASGVESLMSADAKDEIQAGDVARGDTLVGEKQ